MAREESEQEIEPAPDNGWPDPGEPHPDEPGMSRLNGSPDTSSHANPAVLGPLRRRPHPASPNPTT